MAKEYTEGQVTYKGSGRSWKFTAAGGRYEYKTPRMPGGAATAHKVARVINGGLKRTKTGDIDNLARTNMSTIFHNAAKAVARTVAPGGFYQR
jgi:hypothetical protein